MAGERRDVLGGGIQEAYEKRPCHLERLYGMLVVGVMMVGGDGGRGKGCFEGWDPRGVQEAALSSGKA